MVFKDTEDIERVVSIHKDILSSRKRIEKGDYERSLPLNITYYLKNGQTVVREYYSVPEDVVLGSSDLQLLYAKAQKDPARILEGRNYNDIELYIDYGDTEELSSSDKRAFLEAVAEDLGNISFSDRIKIWQGRYDSGDYICSMHMQYNYPKKGMTSKELEDFFAVIPGYNYWNELDNVSVMAHYTYDIYTLQTPAMAGWVKEMVEQGKITPGEGSPIELFMEKN